MSVEETTDALRKLAAWLAIPGSPPHRQEWRDAVDEALKCAHTVRNLKRELADAEEEAQKRAEAAERQGVREGESKQAVLETAAREKLLVEHRADCAKLRARIAELEADYVPLCSATHLVDIHEKRADRAEKRLALADARVPGTGWSGPTDDPNVGEKLRGLIKWLLRLADGEQPVRVEVATDVALQWVSAIQETGSARVLAELKCEDLQVIIDKLRAMVRQRQDFIRRIVEVFGPVPGEVIKQLVEKAIP